MGTKYKVENLISNLPSQADNQDPLLVNPWGMLIDGSDNLWVADNGSGVITHYNARGEKLPPIYITIPPVATIIPSPSGLTFNRNGGFVISNTNNTASSYVILCTENGTIDGYSPLVDPNNTIRKIDNSLTGSVYKGLVQVGNYLYVTDFFNNKIAVFDYNWNPVTTFPFVDNDTSNPLPSGFAPFNIVYLNNHLYVLYALQLSPANKDDQPGSGNGYVSVFNLEGVFIRRLISGGSLNSPWGLIKSPEKFGYDDHLLIGNNGDGVINVYDRHGHHTGRLRNKYNQTIKLDGLWELVALHKQLYFSSGSTNAVAEGLVGKVKLIKKKTHYSSSDE